MVMLLAVAGLGIDIGRMYLIKSELQAYADAAALSAAMRLDGSDPGLSSARQAPAELASGPHAMRWNMGTQPITEVLLTFAKGDAAPDSNSWQSEPKSANGYRFARVTVTAHAPVIFLRAFEPFKDDASLVAAVSVAVRTQQAARLYQ